MTDVQTQDATEVDAKFLVQLARRLSRALYYGKLDAIGTNGSVSPGLLHDDYDKLRDIAFRLHEHESLTRSGLKWVCDGCGLPVPLR